MGDFLKKPWLIIVIISLIISVAILVEGGVEFTLSENQSVEKKETDTSKVVLRVEDITFKYLEFQNILQQVKSQAEWEERELTDKEAEEEAIEMLIDQGVLIKYAEQQGMAPSQEDIDNRFAEIITGYGMPEEDFLKELEQEGISSREEVNNLLRHELAVSALFDMYIEEIEVSDDDVYKYYEEYVEELLDMELGQEEIPSFEDVEEFMKSNIVYEKAVEVLTQKAREIRGQFDIEVMI